MESNNLIESFKSANQSLRKRAITLGILMLIAIALEYSEQVRFDRVIALMDYEYSLETISKLSDSCFRDAINGDGPRYFSEFNVENADRYVLFDKVKEDNYQKNLIFNEIDNIEQKCERLNEAKSIGLFGMTIPLEPVIYLSLIFVLIIFHDFAQIIIFRNQVYRRIRKENTRSGELGFEFFGFYNHSVSAESIFLKLVSSLITFVLIICPMVTSFMLFDLNRSNSSFLSIINLICFVIIVIDTIIILNTENTLNFRYWSNRYLGKHNLSLSRMRRIWALPILFIIILDFGLGIILFDIYGSVGIYFFLYCLVPPIPLYFYLNLTYHKPSNINRTIRAGLLILNVFWVYVVFHQMIVVDEWKIRNIQMMGEILLGAFFGSMVFAFTYGLFFMRISKKKSKNL